MCGVGNLSIGFEKVSNDIARQGNRVDRDVSINDNDINRLLVDTGRINNAIMSSRFVDRQFWLGVRFTWRGEIGDGRRKDEMHQ